MKIKESVIDYRKLRPDNINSPQFSHLKLLLYWPIFGLLFWYAEKRMATDYYVMYHPLDSVIPFCEIFVIPYIFWFVFLIGIHRYTLLYDIDAFRKLMKYIMITYTTGLVIFYLFPTCQMLRPEIMPRDNFLTRFMTEFYAFDTHTNVCPSLHVVGSMAVMFTAWNTKGLQSTGCKTVFGVTAFLISISTVFLKQHSVIDVAVGMIISLAAYLICFTDEKEKIREKTYIRSKKRKTA